MQRDEIILAHKDHLFPAVFHNYREPLVVARAKDQHVWDADGRQYLDFFGGIVTVSVGHCNERVTAAIQRQAAQFTHTSPLYMTEPQSALAKRVSEVTPGAGAYKSFFTNSGTEANETAVQLARCYTGSTEIIALRHSYHGRTSLGMSLSGQGTWRGSGMPQPGIVHAHNAYCYRCPFGLTYPSCDVKCAQDVEDLIKTTTNGRVAGMLAEPIQGIGGYMVPPPEYFGIVSKIVRDHGGIFISDEVQTGWGRTGRHWFGIEHWGVEPDVITAAKGLANGLPIGATIAKAEIADSLQYLTLSTFGGNPVSTAAAKAVIDYVGAENLHANCEAVGGHLFEGLIELQKEFPVLGDVRGKGLLLAVELVTDPVTKEPAKRAAMNLMEATRRNGILVGKGGLHANVVRITPPMNVTKADAVEFLVRFRQSLAETMREEVAA